MRGVFQEGDYCSILLRRQQRRQRLIVLLLLMGLTLRVAILCRVGQKRGQSVLSSLISN